MQEEIKNFKKIKLFSKKSGMAGSTMIKGFPKI